MKKYFILLCLPLMMAACSEDIEGGDPTPDPTPEENDTEYIEFKGNMMPMTRSAIDESKVSTARLYAWSDSVRYVPVNLEWAKELFYKNCEGTGVTLSLFYDRNVKQAWFPTPESVTLTRSKDDPAVWDYSDKLRWSEYANEKLSFLSVIEPDEQKTTNLELNGISAELIFGRSIAPSEYDEMNKETYYKSGDLTDAMVAFVTDCTADEFAGKKEVELNFRHLYPRINLNAKLGEENAIAVNVKDAWIVGLHVNGYLPAQSDTKLDESWDHLCGAPQYNFIEMNLSNIVSLTSDYKPLVDKGAEPHVLPQKVKSWTTFAHRDGAGIVMRVNIRNLRDKSWIVGSESKYALVYVPFPLDKLETGHIYDVNIVFGAQFRENGTVNGYQLSYQPQIVEWETESENLELKR